MTRAEQLREKFEAWWPTITMGEPECYYEQAWLAFLAGANAAMDMQFEPGAVRFGTVDETVEPDFGDPPTFMGKPVVFVDLGGEGG